MNLTALVFGVYSSLNFVHVTFMETFRVLEVLDDPTFPTIERKGTDTIHFNLTKSGTETFSESYHEFASKEGENNFRKIGYFRTFVWVGDDTRVDREFARNPQPASVGNRGGWVSPSAALREHFLANLPDRNKKVEMPTYRLFFYMMRTKPLTRHLIPLTLIPFFVLTACVPPAPTVAPVTATSTAIPETSTLIQRPTETLLPTIAVNSLKTGQHPYNFRSTSGKEVRFLLYLPENYDPGQEWPLILFLHGAGERGMNLDLLKDQPLPKLLETQFDFPFIVVSPQVDSDAFWEQYIDPVDELLAHLEATLPIDSNRLYLTGLSMGGFGVWHYALRYPDRFAAIAPIAGGYIWQSKKIPEDICNLKELPIWVFHGGGDTEVEPYHSQVLVDALIACGSDVKFTLYPDVEHDIAWIKAYDDPALYEWFLAHTN